MGLLTDALKLKAPSRFICVIPKQENLPSQCLELITFAPSSPLFLSHGNFTSMSVVLAMNKESMLVDPINCENFKDAYSNGRKTGFLVSLQYLTRVMRSLLNAVPCLILLYGRQRNL